MADVFSLIAAVVGVADVGCRVSILLYKYSQAVAQPDKVIESIRPEVSLISAVLMQLQSALKDDENVRLCKDGTLKTTEDIAVACRSVLVDIEGIIIRYFDKDFDKKFFDKKQKKSFFDPLKRYHFEKKINLLLANLDRLKSTLIVMLEVIKYARSIMTHENGNKERDREILIALQNANLEAEKRYQTLLNAVQSNGSSLQDYLSKLEFSTTSTLASDGNGQQYAVVDRTGMMISGQLLNKKLALKLETISQLINDVEETEKDIKEVSHHSGIWETYLGTGGHHYRHTTITRHTQMPGMGKVRDRAVQQHPISQKAIIKDVYIALMGAVGAGKSTFINVCCGESLAQISRGPEHCTESIGEYHFMYTPEIRIHLIDTPGFDDAHRSEREILTDLVEWMSQSHGEQARLSGILYVHKISDFKMHYSAHRNLRMFEKLCGADSIHSVILVTTNWGYLGDQVTALQHEQELQTRDDYWGSMIKHGSFIIRHDDNHDSAMRILGTFGVLDHAHPSFDHQAETVVHRRGLSESSIEFQSAEQKVDQLLAQYTTVLDNPFAQQRRYTMDPIY